MWLRNEAILQSYMDTQDCIGSASVSLPYDPDTLEQAMRQRNLPLPEPPKRDLDLNAICR